LMLCVAGAPEFCHLMQCQPEVGASARVSGVEGSVGPGGEFLQRNAPYLSKKLVQTREPRCQPVSRCRAFFYIFTAEFLTLGDGEVHGIKETISNESMNVALISALLFTAMLPLAISHTSDIFESYLPNKVPVFMESVLGEAQGEDYLLEITNTISDLCHMLLYTSVLAFFISMVFGVLVLLGVNELGSDSDVACYVKYMGLWLRAPFIILVVGIFSGGAAFLIRLSYTTLETWTIVVESVMIALIVFFAFVWIIGHITTMFRVAHDSTKYCSPILEKEEVQEDLQKLFEIEDDPSLASFIEALGCKTPLGNNVPLSNLTKHLAATFYFEKLSSMLGISVDRLLQHKIESSEWADPGYTTV